MKKILIITSTPPNHKGVGDIFLENAIKDISSENIMRVSVIKNSEEQYPQTWCGMKSHVIRVDKTHLPFLSSYKLIKFNNKYSTSVANEIVDIIKENNIEKVWITLSSPELILIAKELFKQAQIDLYSTIWDIPEYLLKNNNINYFLSKYIQKKFNEVLLESKKVSVIDEGMKLFLPNNLHSKIHIIRNGIDFPESNIEKIKIKSKKSIKIVFAGSIYAKKEWNCLVESLISTDFIINNKLVELICIGKLPRFGVKKDSRINFLGYLPNHEVLNILSGCDIGYVPYWFDKSKRNVVQTSFPGKVSSYVASDLKVLFHGPMTSTVINFINEFKVGSYCTSIDRHEVLRTLSDIDSIVIDSESYILAKKELSRDEMISNFHLFIS
ncbi:hypothetical protein [Pseudoalteromonas sp. SG45-2]|uniref:hypothetical protein n=1 Tax=Pseudoalteromonas sp. SG45-2 TaxID=2760956 RepID=UPI001603C94A|nr:hypothetical protein [Pseudoalteromonas sp. SG45-2]MBB1347094.1 hypothetical protein [Pseudoalteromonas sp. SG45-2]